LSSLKSVKKILLSGKALQEHKKKLPPGITTFEGLNDLTQQIGD
jgi:hypothetical protein